MAVETKKGGYPVHECVFRGDSTTLKRLATDNNYDVGETDMHGNTPLHLAVMLGHKDCIQVLLDNNAPVKVKNALGWSPLAEAVSYGDRQTIKLLLTKLKQQARDAMRERRPKLAKMLKEVDDFYMELKWDFQSWIPLVSRILPSDICRLTKKGASIRLDTTLIDFNDMKWERGDICFIFKGDADPTESLTVLDNKLKVYQKARNEETDLEIEDEVDLLMSTDIVATRMSTKPITFERAQSGWIFRGDRSETVGHFDSDFYAIHGMNLETRKRREHLSEEDIKKNKAFVENFTKSGHVAVDPQLEVQRRQSLKLPPKHTLSWEDYISLASEKAYLGRPMKTKITSKAFKATVAMSKDFPLNLDLLLNLLEVTTTFKHLNKLREFVKMKLPEGFPVKIDIPVLPTVTAKITFQEFKTMHNVDQDYFEIPKDYKEDPTRFPDL